MVKTRVKTTHKYRFIPANCPKFQPNSSKKSYTCYSHSPESHSMGFGLLNYIHPNVLFQPEGSAHNSTIMRKRGLIAERYQPGTIHRPKPSGHEVGVAHVWDFLRAVGPLCSLFTQWVPRGPRVSGDNVRTPRSEFESEGFVPDQSVSRGTLASLRSRDSLNQNAHHASRINTRGLVLSRLPF